MFEIKVVSVKLPLKNPFRIAHGSYDYRENVFLRISQEGKIAYGEAPVVPYYGISKEQIIEDLITHAPGEDFTYRVSASAYTSALLGLESQGRAQEPMVHKGTSYTIAYHDDPDHMVRSIRECGFSTIKVKAGIPGDVERIRIIREAFPTIKIRVDANQGWSFEEACKAFVALERVGIELIEEPIQGTPLQLKELASRTTIPIVLDETIQQMDDLYAYQESVAGIVVKLAKVGGVQAARALMEKARELGMQCMLSSMIESSLGIVSALGLVPLCTWLDLDAPLLLAQDPFSGLQYKNEMPVGTFGDLIPSQAFEELFESAPAVRVE